MRLCLPRGALVWLVTLALGGGVSAAVLQDRFDHWEHRALFPTCTGCHAGVAQEGLSLWPAADDCAACHDGAVEDSVRWSAPVAPRASNLRFTHRAHSDAMAAATQPDSALQCRECHAVAGADRMQVKPAVVENCLACHKIRTAHLEAPDSACATCHLPLAQAVRLSARDVGEFPAPPSHEDPDFGLRGHGRLAGAGTRSVSAACATCHARDFCLQCHVDAPEVAAIQALAPDPRSLAHKGELRASAGHADPAFIVKHAKQARSDGAGCATCHTQESCVACHVGSPATVQSLPAAAPGRGRGAPIRRERPASHGLDFSETHAEPASSRPQSCAACHARSACLTCHVPNAADAAPGYHPAGFLASHPAAAYARETSCADCHNQAQFCATCHLSAGLGSKDGLRGAGYHDAKRSFLLNHGQAARQSLESCVSCHSERDCLTCHSAQGSRRFNPHGPGFDAATLRRKNPSMCTACHGTDIPGD